MDETASVDESEFVYRRIPRVYFDSTLRILVELAKLASADIVHEAS